MTNANTDEKVTRPKRPNSFGPTMRANQEIKKSLFSILYFSTSAKISIVSAGGMQI